MKIAVVSSSLFKRQFLQLLLQKDPLTFYTEDALFDVRSFHVIIYAPQSKVKSSFFPNEKTILINAANVDSPFFDHVLDWDLSNLGDFKNTLLVKLNQLNKTLEKKRSERGIVAIGASAGGPVALQTVLQPVSDTFLVPIVIAQHMPADFTKVLAKRLNERCGIYVKEAEHEEPLNSGAAYIAPGGMQMTVRWTESGPITNIYAPDKKDVYHPSVNQLFGSLTDFDWKTIIVLTGMGSDGSFALPAIKQSGDCTIIAETEQSAAIFGMPKAALKTGHVDLMLSKEEIGKWLAKNGGTHE